MKLQAAQYAPLCSKYKAYKSALVYLVGLLFIAPAAQAAIHSSVPSPSGTAVSVWSGSNSYSVNDVVLYGNSEYINIAATAPVTATATGGTNLLDKSAIVNNAIIDNSSGSISSVGGFQASGYINLAGASAFVTNITIGIFTPFGVGYYDANRNYVGTTTLNGTGFFPAGVPVPVPAGTQYVRFWWLTSSMGTTPDAAIVNAGTTLQTVYTPFGVTTPSAPIITPSAAPTDTTHWAVFASTATPTPVAGPWAGKKMFMLGDSITWINPSAAAQIASNIGATLSSQGATAPGVDGFPGRTFDGFQNGQGPTGIYVPLSAAVLADVDLLVIELGTNQDSNAGLGTPADTPNLNGTMSAQMRSMLETIMSWKPGMRIVVVGPYQSNRYNLAEGTDGLQAQWTQQLPMATATSLNALKNINAAMKAVCNLYSIPYIDTYNESGVNFTTAALWLQDGLHPSGVGFRNFYVPYISNQLLRFAQ